MNRIATSADYALTPDDMAVAVQSLVAADTPGMLWGPPGVGKSAVVAQVAGAMGLALIDVRLGQMDPVDIRGIPRVDESGRTRWAAPAFLPTETDPPALLFLDELSSCPPAMQVAAYELLLDRRIGEYALPPSARVMAAGNRSEDRAVVNRMSSAMASRLVHLTMRVDVDAWQEWALSSGIAIEVVFFLKYRPGLMTTFDPRSREPAFACPRTWEFVSRLVNAGLTGQSMSDLALLAGTVGEGPAVEFAAFLQVFQSLPAPESVLADPLGVKMPETPDVMLALCGALARKGEPSQMDALIAFAKRPDMRTEIGEFLISSALKLHPTSRYTRAFCEWEAHLSKL